MPNYATVDVFGTSPTTGQRILIARTNQEISAELDHLVAGGSKTATPPEQPVPRTGRDATLAAAAPAVATAVSEPTIIGKVPFDATVLEVTITPEGATTGANTNTRTYNLVNKGTAGGGTTVVATLALTSGVNTVAFDEKVIPLTTTIANRNVSASDTLVLESTHSASGLADPGGLVQVVLTERDA